MKYLVICLSLYFYIFDKEYNRLLQNNHILLYNKKDPLHISYLVWNYIPSSYISFKSTISSSIFIRKYFTGVIIYICWNKHPTTLFTSSFFHILPSFQIYNILTLLLFIFFTLLCNHSCLYFLTGFFIFTSYTKTFLYPFRH